MKAFFGTLAYNAGYNDTLHLLGKMSVGRLVQKTKQEDADDFFRWVFDASKTDAELKKYKDSVWTNELEVEYKYEDLIPLKIAERYINLRKV